MARSEGLEPNTQIARQLGISEGTVRTHLETIYDKLGVSSRTAAVTRAFPDGTANTFNTLAGGPGVASPRFPRPSLADAISLMRERLA
jgi:hypothetical protein